MKPRILLFFLYATVLAYSVNAFTFIINMECPYLNSKAGYRTVNVYRTTQGKCLPMEGGRWYTASCDEDFANMRMDCEDNSCETGCSTQEAVYNATTNECADGMTLNYCTNTELNFAKLLNSTSYMKLTYYYDQSCKKPAYEKYTATNLCLSDRSGSVHQQLLCLSQCGVTMVTYEDFAKDPTCSKLPSDANTMGPWPTRFCGKRFENDPLYSTIECVN